MNIQRIFQLSLQYFVSTLLLHQLSLKLQHLLLQSSQILGVSLQEPIVLFQSLDLQLQQSTILHPLIVVHLSSLNHLLLDTNLQPIRDQY